MKIILKSITKSPRTYLVHQSLGLKLCLEGINGSIEFNKPNHWPDEAIKKEEKDLVGLKNAAVSGKRNEHFTYRGSRLGFIEKCVSNPPYLK